MLISYYANKKSSPRLLLWQPSLISFNTPIESGSIIKPCTLKLFQVPILALGLIPFLRITITVGNLKWLIYVVLLKGRLSKECYLISSVAVSCYILVSLKHGPISHEITYNITMTAAGHKSPSWVSYGVPVVMIMETTDWVFLIKLIPLFHNE